MNIGSRKKSMEAPDQHNMPTEPVPLLVPTPFTENLPGQADPFDYATVPALAPYVPSRQNSPLAYPFVSTPDQPATGQDAAENDATPPMIWQLRRFIPVGLLPFGVGMCFVCIQMLLVIRFVAKVWNLSTSLSWVRTVYALSDVVLLPLYALLPPLTQAFFMRVEPYTILAIVLYGFCSRVIVRLLKVIVRMRFQATRL